MWRAPLDLFLLYCELFSECELFSDCELSDARTPLALFLLNHELFSNRELFSDREFHDTRTLAPPHVTHALCLASSDYPFSIVP